MNLDELRKIRERAQKEVELRQKQARIRVVVGMGTSGIAAGARDVLKTFVEEISRRNLNDVIVTQTGERGLSSQEPMVEIFEEGKSTIVYGNMDVEKTKRVVIDHIANGNPVSEYVLEVG